MQEFFMLFPNLFLAGIAGVIGFSIGKTFTANPTEREMFDRIVSMRLDRKSEKVARRDLESELNKIVPPLAND